MNMSYMVLLYLGCIITAFLGFSGSYPGMESLYKLLFMFCITAFIILFMRRAGKKNIRKRP